MEDYLPVYPSLNVPDIQRIITRKKEFSDLAAPADEELPKGGGFFKHQKFFVRFMTMADRVLNIHEPGTGKSCAFISASEAFHRTGSYRKTIIVEKSDTLIDEMKNQIVNRCARGMYDRTINSDDGINISARSRKIRISKALNNWYEFKTYMKFASEIAALKDDEEVINRYSKHIIILDEVHNILSTDTKSSEDMTKAYPQFLRLCQLVKQSKICAITATPMQNDVNEISKLMNLLLPADQAMPENIENLTLAQLEPYFRGKITFVRSSTRAATPKYMGEILPARYEISSPDDTDMNQSLNHRARVITKEVPSGIRVFPTPMGDIQADIYEQLPREVEFRQAEKKAATFVFPFGSEEDFIKKDSRTNKMKWITPPGFNTWEHRGKFVSFAQWLYNNGDTTNLGRLSGKIKAVVDIETTAVGCSFIYTSFKAVSGLQLIGMILNLFGFEIFNDSPEQIFTSEDYSQVKESYPRKKRVALLTSGISPAKQEAIKDLFNSPMNVNGEYIKILIGSPAARDGINVFHCRRMHLINPHWNFSGMIQAINRVLRAQGHDVLQRLLNAEAERRGLTGIEYDNFTNIEVEIYRHCIDYRFDNPDLNDKTNVDLAIYRKAESKELSIRRVLRMMMICAVDAIINRGRNILPRIKDYTQECNYELCDYPSWEQLRDPSYDPSAEPVDYETYNVMYRDTEPLKTVILKELIEQKSISYAKIFSKYGRTAAETEMVIETLNKIREMMDVKIETKEGDKLFIVLGDNGIHLQRQIDMPSPYIRNLSVYESPNTSIITRTPSELFSEMEKNVVRNDVNVVTYIYRQSENLKDRVGSKNGSKDTKSKSDAEAKNAKQKIDPKSELNDRQAGLPSRQTITNVLAYIKSLPMWRQKSLLEECVFSTQRSDGLFETASIAGNILDVFKGFFFKFTETDNNGRLVDIYVHIFKPHNYKDTSHNIVTRNRDPKDFWLFKSNESLGWRDPIEQEFDKYKNLVKRSINADLEPFEKYALYGMIEQDGKFRIRYNPQTGGAGMVQDRRTINRGMDCKSLSRTQIMQVALEEDIAPPRSSVTVPKDEKDMRESLEGTFSKEFISSLKGQKLKNMYLWNLQSDIVKIMCGLLREKLESSGRIYVPYNLYQDTN